MLMYLSLEILAHASSCEMVPGSSAPLWESAGYAQSKRQRRRWLVVSMVNWTIYTDIKMHYFDNNVRLYTTAFGFAVSLEMGGKERGRKIGRGKVRNKSAPGSPVSQALYVAWHRLGDATLSLPAAVCAGAQLCPAFGADPNPIGMFPKMLVSAIPHMRP